MGCGGGMILLLSRLTSITLKDSFQRWLKGFIGVVFIGFGVKLVRL